MFGPVASVPTAWRCLDEIAAAGAAGRRRIARALGRIREHVWGLLVDRHGRLPAIRIADQAVRGMAGIRIDGTLVTAHLEKEQASPT